MSMPAAQTRSAKARRTALEAASRLFYRQGAHAVGMEAIVAESGIAKTTIYRHFPAKDDLIAAFLEEEDRDFWCQWDAAVAGGTAPEDELASLCHWIGAKVDTDGYRGCPQINMAAEFADRNHPARIVARRHKKEMLERLTAICRRNEAARPEIAAHQIALLFDGAFSNDGRLAGLEGGEVLTDAVRKLIQI